MFVSKAQVVRRQTRLIQRPPTWALALRVAGPRTAGAGGSAAFELVGQVLHDVLHLPGCLVDLALALQLVVVGEVARRFLDAALGLVQLSTHGALLSGLL